MTENPGLTLLTPGLGVAVIGQEHHQATLLGYAPPVGGRGRRVGVELRLGPIGAGTRAGQRGVEVRLDGLRVGELSPHMAQRYTPLLEDVLRRGGRPGCLAFVRHGRRDIEVELRLPVIRTDPRHLVAGESSSARPPSRARKRYSVGAGIVALLLVIAVNTPQDDPSVTAAPGITASDTATPAPSPDRIPPPPQR